MPLIAPAPLRRRTGPPAPAVVLADGDAASLDATGRFLMLHGYEVETATGGVECLRELRRHADPILVLDFDLPWGGGDGVLALVRADRALAGTRVVLTTSSTPPDRVGRLVAAAVQRVLPRPVAPEVLLDVIRGLHLPPGPGSRRDTEGRP